MNHTPQIKRAIQFAARKYHGQFRAEKEPLPYVTHLFSVALLVAEDGASDDVVTAALLHATLEDTDTTREEIVAAFNERVATLVAAVSEVKEKDGNKLEAFLKEGESLHASWKQPVEEYLWYHGEALRIAQKRLPEHRLSMRLAEVHAKEGKVFA